MSEREKTWWIQRRKCWQPCFWKPFRMCTKPHTHDPNFTHTHHKRLSLQWTLPLNEALKWFSCIELKVNILQHEHAHSQPPDINSVFTWMYTLLITHDDVTLNEIYLKKLSVSLCKCVLCVCVDSAEYKLPLMQKTCRKLCFTMTALHLKTRSTHWIPITVTFMNVTLHPVCLPSYTSFYLTLHRWHLFNNYVSASLLADISVQLIKIIFFRCSRVTDVWVTWEKKNEAERKLKKKKMAPESCTTRIAHICTYCHLYLSWKHVINLPVHVTVRVFCHHHTL